MTTNQNDRNGEPGRAPTLDEIARRVGVSRATVSNAYNRPDQLSAALRDRILETARSIGYSGPSPAARSLRRGVAGSIGVALTETLSYAFSDAAAIGFMHGLTAGLEPLGLSVLLVPASPRQDASAVREAIVDGFIVYSMPPDHPHVLAMQERGVPVVMVDQPRTSGVPFVGIDNRAAARSVADHVLDLGHRRLAVVAFPRTAMPRRGPVSMEDQGAITREVTRDRLQGYRDAVEAAGLDWCRVRVEERLRSDAGEGLDAGRALLAPSERPTAILAMSDQLALGVLQAAQERGLAVPSDLSIVGFDDIQAASLSEPTLTTVRQPLVERGRLAAELLVSAMSGGGGDGVHHVLPTELVVRGSTAAPPPDRSGDA